MAGSVPYRLCYTSYCLTYGNEINDIRVAYRYFGNFNNPVNVLFLLSGIRV
jgi:hypothetical protein